MKGVLTVCARCRNQVRATKCTFIPTAYRDGRVLFGEWVCNDCKEDESGK